MELINFNETLSSFSKKEIKTKAEEMALEMIESGEVDINQQLSEIIRMHDFLTEVVKKFKDEAETISSYGLTVERRNGGKMPQYEDDPIYRDLKQQLDDRKELLNTALKTKNPFYDEEGIEVPKVSVKYKKDSVILKY